MPATTDNAHRERDAELERAAAHLGIDLGSSREAEDELEVAARHLGIVLPPSSRELEAAEARDPLSGSAGYQAVAELVVLTAYDELRRTAGHDYGNGQRGAELRRRERELRESSSTVAALWRVGGVHPSAEELLAAFERVGFPRLARAGRQAYAWPTPTSRRSYQTWQKIELRYRSAVRREARP